MAFTIASRVPNAKGVLPHSPGARSAPWGWPHTHRLRTPQVFYNWFGIVPWNASNTRASRPNPCTRKMTPAPLAMQTLIICRGQSTEAGKRRVSGNEPRRTRRARRMKSQSFSAAKTVTVPCSYMNPLMEIAKRALDQLERWLQRFRNSLCFAVRSNAAS